MVAQKDNEQRLDRRWVVGKLLENRGDALVIAGVGSTVWDTAAVGDSPLTFPLWNAMGAAAMVGLGLALAQPKRPVLVVTGDGEIIMQMSALSTIAAKRPDNLSIVVMDNEVYQETGGQPTHTGMGTNLAAVAKGCGFESASIVSTEDEVEKLAGAVFARRGLLLAQVKIGRQKAPRVMPPRDGSYLKDRFRGAVLGERAFK